MGAEALDYVQIGGSLLVFVIILYMRYQISSLEARNAEIEAQLHAAHKKLQ
jgi:hypothetical protein